MDQGLTLSLGLTSEADHTEAEWRFAGVTQLRFRGDSTELLGILLLQCEDVSSLGWDGTRYRVRDYEEEFVSFYCEAIQVIPRSKVRIPKDLSTRSENT